MLPTAIPRSTPASAPSVRIRNRITTRCRFAWRSAYSHGLQYEAAYTFAHALDNASSASLGSVNNGDFRDQRYPNLEYGNADFDVRHRFVFSYVYDLPFGRGRMFAKNASGFVNQILGNWQMSGSFPPPPATTTPLLTSASFQFRLRRHRRLLLLTPQSGRQSQRQPCVPGTLFNTCAFDAQHRPGNIRQRRAEHHPGSRIQDLGHVSGQAVSDSASKSVFEFRAEFFNMLNHVNFLFGQFGAISAEPTPLELTGNISGPSEQLRLSPVGA